MLTLIHYGEIGLKGKNRSFFEKQLMKNIKKITRGKVKRTDSRLILEGGNQEKLKNVFGIAWYASVYRTTSNFKDIQEKTLKKLKEKVKNKPSFAVYVNRADKNFPLNSMKTAALLGEKIIKNYSLKVNLSKPQLAVFVEITKKQTYIFFEKNKGLGGLPVNSSGQILSLFSGGIDSSVSSYLMMKRGCQINLIHFHVFPKNNQVKKTKIIQLVKQLQTYQPKISLYLIPYYPFQIKTISIHPGYELVVFRRFMLKTAEKLALKNNFQALVTGDSLGQVASQTLENIVSTETAVNLPIFRPLITYDKQEIIDLAKKIQTYNLSISSYKDCCSIISRKPKTRTKLKLINQIEEEISIDKIIDESLKETERY